ncbi:unnamed protein product [Nippostrongylus brasiliensis]|uniref:Uncharacterized protein n=1 Tax=Nippostrongylus brasiliensis TaxID=27835 RepID=A0A158R1V5_NIPBR|nr:unnamed protein product [Nippostrongylus brasiliensis]
MTNRAEPALALYFTSSVAYFEVTRTSHRKQINLTGVRHLRSAQPSNNAAKCSASTQLKEDIKDIELSVHIQ